MGVGLATLDCAEGMLSSRGETASRDRPCCLLAGRVRLSGLQVSLSQTPHAAVYRVAKDD